MSLMLSEWVLVIYMMLGRILLIPGRILDGFCLFFFFDFGQNFNCGFGPDSYDVGLDFWFAILAMILMSCGILVRILLILVISGRI